MDPLLLAGFAVALALVIAVLMFLSKPKAFLNKTRQSLKIAKIVELSHDTKLFRFELPSPSMTFGLPRGKHVKLFAPNQTGVEAGKWNGRPDPEAGADEIARSYSPCSSVHAKGYAEIVIKVYASGAVERFPDGGKLSQHMGRLKAGDSVEMSGPTGVIEYVGRGSWKHSRRDIAAKRVGMLAGGTGLTPMFAVIQDAVRDPSDTTEFSLIYANQTLNDILIKDRLDALAKEFPDKFKVHYTLDRPPKKWAGSTGFIDADMIAAHLPAPSNDTLIVMCGPPPMIKFACRANLDALSYDKRRTLAF